MQVKDIKKQIREKMLQRFFVFTGSEIEAQRIYINKISEVTGKPVKRIDTVGEAFSKRGSILKVSNVFVARDDMDFWKSGTEVSTLEELLGNNILIVQMTSIDKRSKAFKQYADYIVEFEYMDSDVLYKYVHKECPMQDNNVFELIEMCEHDYKRILLEVDKINRLSCALSVSVDEAFSKMVAEGVITRPPKDAIFDFTNAMLMGQIDRAFMLLEDCKAIGEPPLRIISVLYSNFKRVLQYQVAESRDVCAETGLTPFDVKLAKQSAGVWSSSDLVYFLKVLQGIEQGIKTGEVEEGIALDYLMVSLL